VKLYKAHALGNDYFVLEEGPPLDAALVRAVCDRHRGAGADGILEPFAPGDAADFAVRIWNPDGSVAEKSGNGLRIFARWLVSERGAPSSFSVWTGACRVRCDVVADAITVDMGAASFEPKDVPVIAMGPLLEGELALSSAVLAVTAVGMGNPHCVIFRDEPLESAPFESWGAEIERHPRFPHRTNVQLARVIDRTTVEIRIWERGAGITLSSGSSSCAVAAAGVRTGRLDPGRIEVRMPGGKLFVSVGETGLRLEGPVEPVGRIVLEAAWLAARGLARA
jgi:diaminopimelate epimerase